MVWYILCCPRTSKIQWINAEKQAPLHRRVLVFPLTIVRSAVYSTHEPTCLVSQAPSLIGGDGPSQMTPPSST